MQLFDSSGSGISTQHVASLALAALEFEPQATIMPLNGLFEGTDLRVVAGGLAPAFRCCMLDIRRPTLGLFRPFGRCPARFQSKHLAQHPLVVVKVCVSWTSLGSVPVQVVVRLP